MVAICSCVFRSTCILKYTPELCALASRGLFLKNNFEHLGSPMSLSPAHECNDLVYCCDMLVECGGSSELRLHTTILAAEAKPAEPTSLPCYLYLVNCVLNEVITRVRLGRSTLEIAFVCSRDVECFLHSSLAAGLARLKLMNLRYPPPLPWLLTPNQQDVLTGVVKDLKGLQEGKMPGQMTIIALTGAMLLLMIIFAVGTPSKPRPKKD